MKTKIICVFSIFLVIIYSSLIFAQSPYHLNHSNHSSSINDYLIPEYESKSSSNFIRMDSLIATSVQGTSLKNLFQYNVKNKIAEWLILDDFDSGWSNSAKRERYYDEQGNLITQISLDWNTDKWDSSSRNNYSYEMEMLSQSLFQVYNNNSWGNRTRYNYVYDQNQNLSNTLIESWINNKWQNSSLSTAYYSLKDKRDSILFQTWVNSDWHNDKKTVYYYSENQIDLDSLVLKSWNGLSWINSLKQEVVNDANHNQIEQLEKIWNSGVWLNSIRRFFSYNEANFIKSANCEIWDNNQWINGDGDIIFKNPDGFIVGFITNTVSAYYSNIVNVSNDVNSNLNSYILFQNYPNPFNPSTLIEYKIPKSNFVEIKVYDVLGKEIATLVDEYKSKGIYKAQFNTNDLPSGVYIYRMIAGSFSETKKMILMR